MTSVSGLDHEDSDAKASPSYISESNNQSWVLSGTQIVLIMAKLYGGMYAEGES